jgi:hypothetical protein
MHNGVRFSIFSIRYALWRKDFLIFYSLCKMAYGFPYEIVLSAYEIENITLPPPALNRHKPRLFQGRSAKKHVIIISKGIINLDESKTQ